MNTDFEFDLKTRTHFLTDIKSISFDDDGDARLRDMIISGKYELINADFRWMSEVFARTVDKKCPAYDPA